MTAPEESFTVPNTTPKVDCADAAAVSRNKAEPTWSFLIILIGVPKKFVEWIADPLQRINFALITGSLAIAVGDQIRHSCQSSLIGRIRETLDDSSGLIGERLSAFPHPLHARVMIQYPTDFLKRNPLVVLVAEHCGHLLALIRRRLRQRINQRESDFPLAQIVADRLTKNALMRREIEYVLHQLERDSPVPSKLAPPV